MRTRGREGTGSLATGSVTSTFSFSEATTRAAADLTTWSLLKVIFNVNMTARAPAPVSTRGGDRDVDGITARFVAESRA